MRVLLTILIGGLAAGCTMESEPVDRAAPATSAIVAATQGRVAGDPVACIDQRGLRNTRTVAGAIIFEGPGDVVYVNEGLGGCQALAHGRAIRADASGDLTPDDSGAMKPAVAWNHDRKGNYMQTPIVVGDFLYACRDNGVLTCFDARTGKEDRA